MPINSRSKGKRGELELAHFLTEHGFPASRGQQFAGGADSPDIKWSPPVPIHLEAKRTETLSIYKAMEQAARDAGTSIPCVCHRRNRGEWLAIMPLRDLLSILNAVGAKAEEEKTR